MTNKKAEEALNERICWIFSVRKVVAQFARMGFH